jgi:hypothetical protein
MSDVAEKLRAARALIERGWTQGAPARTKGGVPVWGGESSAVCWCVVSAMCRATPDGQTALLSVPLRKTIGLSDNGGGLTEWNDAPERTQAEVLAAFDRAIELAEAQS